MNILLADTLIGQCVKDIIIDICILEFSVM